MDFTAGSQGRNMGQKPLNLKKIRIKLMANSLFCISAISCSTSVMLHYVTSIRELSKPLQVRESITDNKMQSYDKPERFMGWKGIKN